MNGTDMRNPAEVDSQFSKQGFDALILPSSALAGLKVATLTLEERWIRGFGFEKAASRLVEESHLTAPLTSAVRPVVLAAGAWVFDQYALEAVVENAPRCGESEVLLPEAPGLPVAPVLCLGTSVARALASRGVEELSEGFDGLLSWLEGQPGVTVRRLPMAASFWARIRGESDVRSATWGLLKRLQYRPGGLVAIYLNRPISIRFSKWIVDGKITPNQTTLMAFAVGLVGVAMVLMGGWGLAVAGTFLLHVNSVWDGIDGELARMRYQTSEFGAYLDSVCDEILNALIIFAAGVHISRVYPLQWGISDPNWWLWMGLFGGGGAFLYALTHWHCKAKHGLGFYWWWEAYKPRKQVQRSTSAWFYFKKLFCKDSILLLFFFAALFQFMHVLVFAAAVMGVVNLVLLFIHIVILRARW